MEYFREEINLLEEAVNAGQIEENPERLAYAYEHMAVAVQQLGDYETAFVWHGKSLHILENFHAADKSGILLGHVNKSWALWKFGALDEASRLLELVLVEAQEILEENSEDFQAGRV